MSDSEYKNTRVAIRRVMEHLRESHLHAGVQVESPGFVDVLHHPESVLPSLNYVTPRRRTAWIPEHDIEKGLIALRGHNRRGRVRFAEGLYPPIFVRTLRNLGLEAETDAPIMVYHPRLRTFKQPTLPPEINVVRVSGQEGMGMWWYVWRNAHYNVTSSGVDPLRLGQDLQAITLGNQIDLLMYRYSFPIGVARLTITEETVHITATAIMREVQTDELIRLLDAFAVHTALETGCEMVFITGDHAGSDDEDRRRWRDLGFVDSGSVVTYAERAHSSNIREKDDALAKPVLIL